MRNHDYYHQQAAGCRRLRAQVSDPVLAGEIDALASRYDTLASLWCTGSAPALSLATTPREG